MKNIVISSLFQECEALLHVKALLCTIWYYIFGPRRLCKYLSPSTKNLWDCHLQRPKCPNLSRKTLSRLNAHLRIRASSSSTSFEKGHAIMNRKQVNGTWTSTVYTALSSSQTSLKPPLQLHQPLYSSHSNITLGLSNNNIAWLNMKLLQDCYYYSQQTNGMTYLYYLKAG